MAQLVKVFATNISDGARLFTSSPPVTLQSGQSTDGKVDIDPAELETMRLFGQFDIEADEADLTEDDEADASFAERLKVIEDEHDAEIAALTIRAERAEDELAVARAEIAALTAQAAQGDGGATDTDLIRVAIEGLDPKNDDHWTAAGLPQVDAVKAALGSDVTRAQIEAAAPDAKRPA